MSNDSRRAAFEPTTSYRPFKFPWAVEVAKKHHVDMFWGPHQINLQDDLQQYYSENGLATSTVSHGQNKNILDKTLCMFTEMDVAVGGGYVKLLGLIGNNELRNMFLTFAAREVVHQQAYATCAESFGFSDTDWSAFAEYAEMVDKLEAMTEDMVPAGASLELRACVLLAQILLGEGIGLFGAFATLLNQKRCGLLIGFNDVNEWSLKDEQEHVTNNIRALKAMMAALTEVERVVLQQVIEAFVERYRLAEHRYLELVFQMGGAEGLTLEQMKDYINYLCLFRLFQLGYVTWAEVGTNPLEWMDWILAGGKHDNFFEKKVTDYSHAGLQGPIDYSRYLD